MDDHPDDDLFDDVEETDPNSFFLRAVIFELGLGGLGLFLAWLSGYDARELIPRPEQLARIASGIGWGVVATLPMLAAVFLLERLDFSGVQEVSRLTKDRLLAPMRNLTTLELLAISVCAGLGEELLFRGFLQGWLIGSLEDATTPTIVFGIAVAALAFGLVHALTPTYFVLASVVGAYLGYLTVLTENLIVAIVAHSLYDAVQLIMTVRESRAQEASSGNDS